MPKTMKWPFKYKGIPVISLAIIEVSPCENRVLRKKAEVY
jgi:hypothetical protein